MADQPTGGRDLHGWAVAIAAFALVAFSLWLVVDKFSDNDTAAETIVTILAPVFGIIGTVAGAYFGVATASKANETTNKAVSELAESNRAIRDLGERPPGP